MTPEAATSLTDVALSLGTLTMGLTVGARKSFRTWTALFIMLGLAAGFGALYHGVARFHTREFSVLVATTSVSSAFLFLAACLCTAKPTWTWLHWTWPVMALAGLLLGGFLAPQPFWYISAVSAACVLISILVLQNAPNKKARSLIYTGIVLTLVGLLIQKTDFNGGPLNHNSAFHLLQLTGNLFFWLGARRT